MANPQKENGYTPIANEIIDQLCRMPFNGTQFKIILFVFRYTYGYSRKHHELSETFIASAVGSHKRQVQRELKSLIDANVLTVVKPATFNTSRVVAFNKYYEVWRISHQASNQSPGDKLVAHTGGELVTSPNSKKNEHENLENNDIKGLNVGMTDSPPGGELAAHIKQNTIYKTNIKTNIVDQTNEKKFIKPSLEEVKSYCLERNKGVNAQKWYDHYTSNGWKVGKNPMKDWKAAVRTWEPEKPKEEKSKYQYRGGY